MGDIGLDVFSKGDNLPDKISMDRTSANRMKDKKRWGKGGRGAMEEVERRKDNGDLEISRGECFS